jgi:hypothetical protein
LPSRDETVAVGLTAAEVVEILVEEAIVEEGMLEVTADEETLDEEITADEETLVEVAADEVALVEEGLTVVDDMTEELDDAHAEALNFVRKVPSRIAFIQ